MAKELNASEAIYGFVGWLTTRSEVTLMGGNHDCTVPAELVKIFCEVNKLPEISEDWPKNLNHPIY